MQSQDGRGGFGETGARGAPVDGVLWGGGRHFGSVEYVRWVGEMGGYGRDGRGLGDRAYFPLSK